MKIGPEPAWMFDFTGNIIPIFLAVMIGIVALSAGRSLLIWSRNNRSPQLTVSAKLVSKRNEVSQGTTPDNAGNLRTTTSYYLTYELESGLRMEFKVDGAEYGMSAEGDRGHLTYQGTRYGGFCREGRHTAVSEP